MKYVFGQQHKKYFQLFKQPYFTHEQNICGIGPFYNLETVSKCVTEPVRKRLQKARAGTFIQITNRLSSGSPPYGIKVIEDNDAEVLIHNLNELKELNKELNETGIPERIRRIRKNIEQQEINVFGKKPKGF